MHWWYYALAYLAAGIGTGAAYARSYDGEPSGVAADAMLVTAFWPFAGLHMFYERQSAQVQERARARRIAAAEQERLLREAGLEP